MGGTGVELLHLNPREDSRGRMLGCTSPWRSIAPLQYNQQSFIGYIQGPEAQNVGRDRPCWAQDRSEVIRRCQGHSVAEAAGTRSLPLRDTSGCDLLPAEQSPILLRDGRACIRAEIPPFMDAVNVRYGQEVTTPEATDGWYKV